MGKRVKVKFAAFVLTMIVAILAGLPGLEMSANVLAAAQNKQAKFILNTFPNPPEGGYVYNDYEYNVGEAATLTAKPMPGWVFSGWYEFESSAAGIEYTNLVSADAEYTFFGDLNDDGTDKRIYRYVGRFTRAQNQQGTTTQNTTTQNQQTVNGRDIFNPLEEGYSFVNTWSSFGYSNDYQIPFQAYVDVYGQQRGTALYNQYRESWYGSCFGFSVTSAKFYAGAENAANYGAHDTYFIPTPYSPTNPVTKMIERAQISWWLPGVSKVNFDRTALLSAVDNFEKTGNSPIVLYLDANALAGTFHYCHAVVPWRTERAGSDTRIYIYDPNAPGDESIFVTAHSNGNFSCNFDYGSYPLNFNRIGFIKLEQILNSSASSPQGSQPSPYSAPLFLSVNEENAEILTLSGESVENLTGAQKVESIPIGTTGELIHESIGYTAYWLPSGEYEVISDTDEPIMVTVLNDNQAYTVDLTPNGASESFGVRVGGETPQIIGSAQGNITEYNEQGEESAKPLSSTSTESESQNNSGGTVIINLNGISTRDIPINDNSNE